MNDIRKLPSDDVSEEFITPDTAALYLLKSAEYARLRSSSLTDGPVSDPGTLDTYASVIRTGKWTYDPENPIVLDPNGQVVDGITQLEACILTGIAIRAAVARMRPAADEQ